MFRVSFAYAVVAWLVLQVADVVFPAISLPEWSMRALLAVLVLAFPVVVVLAWVFQVAPSGSVRREPVKASPGVVALLVAVTLVVGGGLGFLWSSVNSGDKEQPSAFSRPAVAVLPLRDMSPNGDKAYFSDGIHEELISRLAEIRHISVTSRTSVDRYRDSDLGVREIAEELGVKYVLEGSVRHSADRVRITLQFIEASKDEHIWVRDFDKRLSVDELFDIQRDVSENIASLLRTQLTQSELQRIGRVPTDSFAAYEAHLKGRYHYRRYNRPDLRTSLEYWRKAVDLDPDFADAWSGLANGYMLAATAYGWLEPSEAILHAKQYGARALDLDPYNGSTISLIGDIAYWYDYDAKSAEAKYLEGIAVDPHHIGNRLSYAYFLSTSGRHDEAEAQVEYWLDAEPRAAHLHANAAWRYFDARRYADAIRHADIALSIDPGMNDARYSKTYSLLLTDQPVPADQLPEGHWVLKALWLMRTGQQDEARAFAGSLLRENNRPADLALIFAVIGDKDEALRQLHLAIDQHHRGALLINAWEIFDPLRTDDRFIAALRRVGFD